MAPWSRTFTLGTSALLREELAWWCIPVILTREAEAERSEVQGYPRLRGELRGQPGPHKTQKKKKSQKLGEILQ